MEQPKALANGFNLRRAARLLGTVSLLAVVVLFVTAAVPQAVGADESYVVLSDSMSPAIGAGSMAYVSDMSADRIGEGDIVTYRSPDGERVTHRIVKVVQQDGERQFRTKGDANEQPDPKLIASDQVVGRVDFHVPLIGYLVSFGGTTAGLVSLVIIPAVLLVVLELRDLYGSMRASEPARNNDSEGPAEVDADSTEPTDGERGEPA